MPGQIGPANQKQVSLAAGANVTLSTSASGGTMTVTIIGGGTGATGTGVNFSAGTQSAGSGTILFADSNSISWGMAGSSRITASINFPAFGSQSLGASNLGNLSGTSGVASGSVARFLFAGGNNITLSQSLNGASGTLSIIGTQSVQTQNLFNLTLSGNTSGVLAQVSSGVLTLVGGNNITLSQAGNAVTISAPTPGGLQTAVSGLVAGAATITSGTASFANSNGVSFGIAGQTITASVSVGGNNATLSGNTSGTLALISSGTMTLAGGNNITLSQVGNAVTISAANTVAQSVQTQSNIQAIIPLGNTTGTTGTVQTGSLGIAGGANITISQSSGVNSTNLTIIGQAGIPTIAASGNTSGTVTIGAGSLILAGGNNVTLQGATAPGAMTLSVSVPNTASQTVQTQNLFALTATTDVGGATGGTMGLISSGTMTLAAGSNITLSQSGNAMTIIGQSGGAATATGALRISPGAGSTSGTTALMSLGTVAIVAGANITITQNGGNTIEFKGVTQAFNTLGVSNIGNTLGTTGPISNSQYQWILAGGNNITLSQSKDANSRSLTITISGPNIGTNNIWTPPYPGSPIQLQGGNSSLFIYPALCDQYVSATQVNFPISVTMSTSSNSSHAGTLSAWVGLYTRNVSSLSRVTSGSVSYAWTNTSDNSTLSLTGIRYLTLPINATMTPGDYWIGFMSATSSVNANWITLSNIVHTAQGIVGPWLTDTQNTYQMVPGMGRLSGQTNMPASINFTNLSGNNPRDQGPQVLWFLNQTI